MKRIMAVLLGVALYGFAQLAQALVFPLPPKGSDVVGKVYTVKSRAGDDFTSLGVRYDIGYYELVEANPTLNPASIPADTMVKIPAKYILPPETRQGIVINLAELRLFYYPKGEDVVITEPVGIGRVGWETPVGKTSITWKKKDPTWYSPKSVRDWRAKQGVILPRVVPPGPDNPLGRYAMRLAWPGYLIHGTNDPSGVGRRASAGCIRMYPEDIEVLFNSVKKGTKVTVIDEAYKIGWQNHKLYLEAHVPLQEQDHGKNADFSQLVDRLVDVSRQHAGKIDWALARAVFSKVDGIPTQIGNVGA